MANYVSTPTLAHAFDLGEGPVWNPRTNQLSMVDIFARRVHFFEFHGGSLKHVDEFETMGDVGAALPLSDGSFVLCENDGIYLRDPKGNRSQIAKMPVSGDEFRCNDAKIGPDGNLWVGIMDYDATEGNGSLWRISRSGDAQQLLANQTIPNGLDWWEGNFWFVNGPAEEIRCYGWDEKGIVDTGKKFITNGTPDGLAIDSNGELWLALWGEARVDHFNHHGEVVDTISVPSPHSTSLCFAGENLDSLVMTSALFNMSDESKQQYVNAGDVFQCKVSAKGRAPNLIFG